MSAAPGVGDSVKLSTRPRSNSNRSNAERVPLGIINMPGGGADSTPGEMDKSPFTCPACGQSWPVTAEMGPEQCSRLLDVHVRSSHPAPLPSFLLLLHQVCPRMLSHPTWSGRPKCWWASKLRWRRPVSSQPDWNLQLAHWQRKGCHKRGGGCSIINGTSMSHQQTC